MNVALRGTYVEYVVYMGVTESYPRWFEKMLDEAIFTDESNYTFYVDRLERRPDYYEKQLIENYSVFLRKPNGEVHVTDYDVFTDLYTVFRWDYFTNSGIAALIGDCIEYVECKGGVLPAGYPNWFYEYFTEAFNYPQDEETVFIFDSEIHTLKASRNWLEATAGGYVTVTEHCVFLRNKHGEIRGMRYDDFLKYYDPEPREGIDYGY